jgi:hypothetical protein
MSGDEALDCVAAEWSTTEAWEHDVGGVRTCLCDPSTEDGSRISSKGRAALLSALAATAGVRARAELQVL